MSLWLTIVVIGLITFAIRYSFIGLVNNADFPAIVQRGLRFVPAAVLAAIIASDLAISNKQIDLINSKMAAGAIAIIVAWYSRQVIPTLVAGFIVFLLLN
ncbi:AzlD domain-containing protein [Herpetosiphon llansteffanensis]|uniref:AzlD domain-containing protein n=1 Tax=Herpetosiphon llansteffanensis TaxID=2094568 RepID=UPI000D7B93DC|nr:AzlD domain-containing protein [Herpetosiphon llansteffanensis]